MLANPTGARGITIEYRDGAGTSRSQWMNIYFEHNYGGTIDMTIGTNNEVTYKANIRS